MKIVFMLALTFAAYTAGFVVGRADWESSLLEASLEAYEYQNAYLEERILCRAIMEECDLIVDM